MIENGEDKEAKITINRSANKMSIIGDTSHTDSAIMILNMLKDTKWIQ